MQWYYTIVYRVKKKQGIGGELDEGKTRRQYGCVLQLDLNNNKIRMITLGLHNKHYSFNDGILLQKSYVNANELHIFVKDKSKMKDYWHEFISSQASAEFVGRLIQPSPGTLGHEVPNQSTRANSVTNVLDPNFHSINNLNNTSNDSNDGGRQNQNNKNSINGKRQPPRLLADNNFLMI